MRAHLNDDPFGSWCRIHHGKEQRPELLNDLARDVDEKRQITPSDPFRNRLKRVDGNIRIANEVRVSGSFCLVGVSFAVCLHSGDQRRANLTLESHQIHLSTMFSDANGMILHAGAATNVSYDEDLDVLVLRVLRLLVASWDRVSQATEQPHKALKAVIEKDDEETSGED